MIRELASQQIEVVDADAIAVAIGADDADFKVLGRRFSDRSSYLAVIVCSMASIFGCEIDDSGRKMAEYAS